MPPKQRLLRSIDTPASGSGRVSVNATDDVAPPAGVTVGVPLNLALTTGTAYASAAPTAYINATWDPPETSTNALPSFYTVQVSTSSSFTASGTLTVQANSNSARIEGLLPATLYYVRVRAYAAGMSGPWTPMSPLTDGVNRITTATDTTAAGVPTSISATWIGVGDLLVTWTNPTEANFKDVKVVIRASSGGTIYRTVYSAAGRYLYPVALNLQDTAFAGDPSLYVELQSRTFSNVLGTTVNTGLVTKSAPTAPYSVAHSWTGDTGTAGADLNFTWGNQLDALYWLISINSLAAERTDSSAFKYSLSQNIKDNGAADPTLTWAIVAVDGLGQISTTTSGTATNAAPPTPTVTLTAGFSILIATVGGTQAADFAAYEYVFKRDGTTVRTLASKAAEQQYELSAAGDDGYHSWTCVVRQQDLFGQYSGTVTSSAVAMETLTLSGLRAGIVYSDSIATAPATLKAQLADGVTTAGGVVYNP